MDTKHMRRVLMRTEHNEYGERVFDLYDEETLEHIGTFFPNGEDITKPPKPWSEQVVAVTLHFGGGTDEVAGYDQRFEMTQGEEAD